MQAVAVGFGFLKTASDRAWESWSFGMDSKGPRGYAKMLLAVHVTLLYSGSDAFACTCLVRSCMLFSLDGFAGTQIARAKFGTYLHNYKHHCVQNSWSPGALIKNRHLSGLMTNMLAAPGEYVNLKAFCNLEHSHFRIHCTNFLVDYRNRKVSALLDSVQPLILNFVHCIPVLVMKV